MDSFDKIILGSHHVDPKQCKSEDVTRVFRHVDKGLRIEEFQDHEFDRSPSHMSTLAHRQGQKSIPEWADSEQGYPLLMDLDTAKELGRLQVGTLTDQGIFVNEMPFTLQQVNPAKPYEYASRSLCYKLLENMIRRRLNDAFYKLMASNLRFHQELKVQTIEDQRYNFTAR